MPTFRFAMGSNRCSRTTLFSRCCYGAFFGFGFVLTIITLAVMFWIAWCYFGLTIVQISDAQRRAIVNYSYTTPKPSSTPTTALPSRSTTIPTEETSINSISKSPTTEGLIARGSSRGESQVKNNKRKELAIISSLAKGDFAARDRATHNSNNATTFPPKDVSSSVVPAPRGPSRNRAESSSTSIEKASILTASSEDSEEDRIYARRVLPPGSENRPEEGTESSDRSLRRNPSTLEPVSRSDIAPTKVYDSETKSENSRVVEPPDKSTRHDAREPSRDYIDTSRDKTDLPRRDDIQGSRRTEPENVYREPDFDREYPRRSAAPSDQGRSRYDDFDDERGSRGRYDKRERGRESDDRYSKGDTRVYPDDRGLPIPPPIEDRYRSRERYRDDAPRRGDDDRVDDRYRDYDERSKSRDRDTRYRDRDFDDRPPLRDDRYGDDDRYRPRDDDRYRDRDDDRYRDRDDDRYRDRDDDKYRDRDDERYRSRDDDRYRSRGDDRVRNRDDERYAYRDSDRYRTRDDDRYRVSEEDRYRTRDDDRNRNIPDDRRDTPVRSRDDEKRDRPRVDDSKYTDSATSRLRDTDLRDSVSRSSSSVPGDRRIISSRPEYDVRGEATVTDYDIPVRDRSRSYVRDDVSPSRISRPSYSEDRYRDRDRDDSYRTPSRYEDDARDILPTKTRDGSSYSRSSLIDSRSREGSRYINNERDRVRDDKYYEQDDRIRGTRNPVSESESARRVSDDVDKYRTRLPNERIENPKLSDRREEVILDRRSYASEEDEEYRRGSKTDEAYDDRDRKPIDETRRRYRDDESYSRRDPADDEDYRRTRTRDGYDRERDRSRDRYDDDYRRYDDRYPSKGDKLPPLPVRKYDTYPDDDERPRRRDPEISTMRKEDSRDREEKLRPSSSSRDEERYIRDDYSDSKSSRRRYDDDLSLSDSRDLRDDYSDDRRHLKASRQPETVKEFTLGSSRTSIDSREPTDIVIREKRFQSSSNRHQSSRIYGNNDGNDHRSSIDMESKSQEQVRPLSAKDVIEAAIRHSDGSDQNSRKVHYPVFDPRVSNLTSPEIIRPSERRGTTITAKKRRSV